jgi:uncharacterized membrane protein
MHALTLMFLLLGAVFMASGWFLQRFPPTSKNPWYGYRTSTSMRSPEAWKFAQCFSARVMKRLGIAYVVCASICLIWPSTNKNAAAFGLIFFVVSLVAMLVYIEIVLRKHFPK